MNYLDISDSDENFSESSDDREPGYNEDLERRFFIPQDDYQIRRQRYLFGCFLQRRMGIKLKFRMYGNPIPSQSADTYTQEEERIWFNSLSDYIDQGDVIFKEKDIVVTIKFYLTRHYENTKIEHLQFLSARIITMMEGLVYDDSIKVKKVNTIRKNTSSVLGSVSVIVRQYDWGND